MKVVEYLEDTRETSHGVRGSRSGMPADIMASMKDGVIEPKSVLQIPDLRLLGTRTSVHSGYLSAKPCVAF